MLPSMMVLLRLGSSYYCEAALIADDDMARRASGSTAAAGIAFLLLVFT